MLVIIFILFIMALLIVCLIYPLFVSSSKADDQISEMHTKNIMAEYNLSISKIIDEIQLLLSKYPIKVGYVNDLYEDTVYLNNKYVCNGYFDLVCIVKIIKLWDRNKVNAKRQLEMYDDIDVKFVALNRIVKAVLDSTNEVYDIKLH